MDFRTRDVLNASIVTGLGAMWCIPELGTVAGAAVAITANVGFFLAAQRLSGLRPIHDTALLMYQVCPSCLMPGKLAEVTSEDGTPIQPGSRTAECMSCKMSFQILERDGKLVTHRIGKVDSWE